MPGLVITELDKDGQALKAGLRRLDVIYKYNDTVLLNTNGLIAATQARKVQNKLTVIRCRDVLEIAVPSGSLGVSILPYPLSDIRIEGVGEVLKRFEEQDEQQIIAQVKAEEEARLNVLSRIQLTTTPSLEGYRVTETVAIITAEHVEGINILVDFLSEIRDAAGGRSQTLQSALRTARQTCIAELRIEADRLGANAVIGVSLDYSEISGGGKSMLFLVASGTAVIVEKTGD